MHPSCFKDDLFVEVEGADTAELLANRDDVRSTGADLPVNNLKDTD